MYDSMKYGAALANSIVWREHNYRYYNYLTLQFDTIKEQIYTKPYNHSLIVLGTATKVMLRGVSHDR